MIHIFHKWHYPCSGHRICLKCSCLESDDDYGWHPDSPQSWFDGVKKMRKWDSLIKKGDDEALIEIAELVRTLGRDKKFDSIPVNYTMEEKTLDE